jgi:hypothetical protein
VSDEIQTLKDDIAFVRALAEESGSAMARDGAVLAAAGMIFGLTALQYWLIFAGILDVPPGWDGWLWLDGTIVFLVAMTLIQRRIPSRPSAASRAMRAAWAGVGAGITISGIALGIGAWRLGLPVLTTGGFPIVLFALYGAAWGVVFAVKRRTWFALVATGSFAAAIGCGALMGTPEEWLLLALGLFVLVGVPGAAIVRQARRD